MKTFWCPCGWRGETAGGMARHRNLCDQAQRVAEVKELEGVVHRVHRAMDVNDLAKR